MVGPRSANNEASILNTAEAMIRTRGYNGVSFREIADAVGVKSATVHYYFPTKGALGAAVAARYTEAFIASLGPAEDDTASAGDVLKRFRAPFRRALADDGLMCLAGLLGAEIADLPPEVAAEVRAFFTRAADWLTDALGRTAWGRRTSATTLRKTALKTLATLEGAVLLARIMDDTGVFDEIELDALL